MNISKHKAIIFDIDGTAVNSPKETLPSVRLGAAVRELQPNYYVSAATGRTWSWAKVIMEHLGLSDPCIVAAGTQICDPKTGEAVWQCDMEPVDVDAVMEILKTIPNCRLLYNDYSGQEYYAGGKSPERITFAEPVYFINCIFVPADEATGIMDKLSVVKNLAITLAVSQKAGYKDILITNRLGTKEHAVTELLKLLQVGQRNAIGVGDGHNDIQLFKAVGHRVAMGNAVPELKEAADEMIGEVARDGLAEYLEGINK